MSVIIAKINDESILTTVKQILNIFSKDIAVLNNEEYRDLKFAELLDEGRKTPTLSAEETKKEFKKRGINL